MTGHLATRSHTRCNMLLLVLSNGTNIGVTDHDKDISYNLTDAGVGSVSYKSGTGILTSDVSMSADLDADNYEVTGPIADLVTREAVLGGKFNRAQAWLFQLNWKNTTDGAIKLLRGNVTEARLEGGKFVLEVRSIADAFNQVVGRQIINNCDADYGDTRCGAVVETVAATVSAVTDEMHFTVTFSGSYANGYFDGGKVVWLTGDLAGSDPTEIFSWTSAGVIVLFAPAAEAPAVGDTLQVKRGCGKSRADCMARNNILRFRGYPEVPGSDQILRATIPGQGD